MGFQDPTQVNPDNEVRTVEAITFRHRFTQQQVARFTPVSAARMAQYSRMYPWMPPGISRAASLSGIAPDDPDMIRVANSTLAEGYVSNRILLGQPMRPSALNPGNRDPEIVVDDITEAQNLRARSNEPTDPFAYLTYKGLIDNDGNFIRPNRKQFITEAEGGPPGGEWQADTPAAQDLDDLFLDMMDVVAESQGKNTPIPYRQGEDWLLYHPSTGNSEVIRQPNRPQTAGFAPSALADVPVLGRGSELLGQAQEAVGGVLKPAIRTAGMAWNAPWQEIQSIPRNINVAIKDVQERGVGDVLTHWESPPEVEEQFQFGGEATDLGVALERNPLQPWEETGEGFFVSPTSEVAKERIRREQAGGDIGGHSLTWGRWIASSVFEPNTAPFDFASGVVDFGVALADPSALGLGVAGKARQVNKLFQAEEILDPHVAAGIVTRSVDPMTFDKWLHGPTGAPAVADLTATDSAYQVALKLNNNALEFKHDPAIYRRLAETTDDAQTTAVIGDAINTGKIREVADLTGYWGHGLAAGLKPHMPRSRLIDKMPGFGVRLSDPIETGNQVMRSLRNVKAPEETVELMFNKVAEARTMYGRRNAVLDSIGGVNGVLMQSGFSEEQARGITRLYEHAITEMHRGLTDEVGTEIPTWEKILADGTTQLVPGPHALTELIEDWMPLINGRQARELTSRYPNLTKAITKAPAGGPLKTVLEIPPAALDFFMQEMWKPFALMRGAWLLRVLGEGQIRLVNAGYETIFSGHPIHALGWMISKDRKHLKSIGTTSYLDESWDEVEEFGDALARTSSWAHRPGLLSDQEDKVYLKAADSPQYRAAYTRQLVKFNRDPVYRLWLQTDSRDEFIAQLRTLRVHNESVLDQYREAFPGNLQTDEQIIKFADDIDARFNNLTQGSTELFDIIKSGKFQVGDTTHSIYRKGTKDINPKFTEHVKNFIDDYGPERVIGREPATGAKGNFFAEKWKAGIDMFLYNSMSVSENYLHRSPVFRQAFFREGAEILQFGSTGARQEMIDKARELNIPNRIVNRMEHLAATKKPGYMEIEEMNLYAKAKAMDRVKKILYSYSERRQIFDIMRNFAVFGDAWYEVMSTWNRIVRETGGKPVRRLQQTLEHSINSGVVTENQHGEPSFTYPMSQSLISGLTGVPVALDARVKGLNMFGEIIPGLGPVAQIPLAWFLEGKPDLKNIEEALLPYGGPEGGDITNWKSFMPGWMKTALSAAGVRTFEDNRLYERTVTQIADYKMSTGEYGHSASEQAELWNNSKDAAWKVLAIRAVAQFWLPSAPNPQFYIEDPSGKNLRVAALVSEFHRMEQDPDIGYDLALQHFIDQYGEDAIGAVIPRSRSEIYGLPDSAEALEWVQDNPHIKDNYPLIYGLLVPEGEFDIGIYERQFETGERQGLTARQHIRLISDYLNRYWRDRTMQDMGVSGWNDMTQAQRNQWEEISVLIDEEYRPARYGSIEKPSVEDMIAELEDAVDDPELQVAAAYEPLRIYMDLRRDAQEAVEALQADGRIPSTIKGFQKAKSLAPIRQVLRSEAQDLIEQHPAFKPLWDFVFSRELVDETVEE
jgi:hypothetical protein